MTRAEHLQWCKDRALAYLPESPADAVASMGSDMGKHPETDIPPPVMMLGMMSLTSGDVEGVRRWIEGFN
jgi:hypothetical protein